MIKMSRIWLVVSFLLVICCEGLEGRTLVRLSGRNTQSDNGPASKAYTPPAGSPERKAIIDALRGDQKVVFKFYYLKVHGDWAWADV
ncbi:MAG TPA: hypothetical protein VKF81_13440, partial [Blastocatellia bacterium]|nr:hypothetical protein [Blastocatellia bacterium]